MTNITNLNAATLETEKEDEFLASLRIDQAYLNEAIGARQLLLTIPVRKPNRDEFFRVHPVHQLLTFSLELKAERETYFITQAVASLVAEFIDPTCLRLCVSRQGVRFLWPVKLPKDDKRGDAWRKSAIEAAEIAVKKWVRISADMNLGAYQVFMASAELGDPKWPTETWPEVLKIALKDKRIDSEEHDVIRQLLGQG